MFVYAIFYLNLLRNRKLNLWHYKWLMCVCMIEYKKEAPVYYTTMTEKKRDKVYSIYFSNFGYTID